MKPKISIVIPCHNNAPVIGEAIESALAQIHPGKEVIVIDDGSTDNSVEVIKKYKEVRLVQNEKNLGIGLNLAKCMDQAQGKYVLYLCADDIFTNNHIASDVCRVFDSNDTIGVIGRYYYFFMDGKEGAIGVHRDMNILTSSCCPSGMAFRNKKVKGDNKIFIEMPLIVKQYLEDGWGWTMFEYDVFAARFHPGGNTGTKTAYYTQSVWQNWVDLIGNDFEFFPIFVMLKNRAPKMLWREICLAVKLKKTRIMKLSFWIYTLTALLVPGYFLKKLTLWQRNTIGRARSKIIERGNNE